MKASDDRWEVCGNPDWTNPIFEFVKANQERFELGVTGLSILVLRMVESDTNTIGVPLMGVGNKGELKLNWEFLSGSQFRLHFISCMEFRYRYETMKGDTGWVMINKHHPEYIRRIFHEVFNTNTVTEQSMVYHLSRRYQ